MPPEGNLALGDERTSHTTCQAFAHLLATPVGMGLGQEISDNDEDDGRASAEPEQGSPTVRRGVDQGATEGGRKQVAKRVALLEHARDHTTGLLWAVFQRRCGDVAIQTAHCNAKEGAAGQELLVCLTEARCQLQDNEQDIIDYEGPLSAIAIRCDTERDRTHGPQHQNQSDAPGDVGVFLVKGVCQTGHRDGNGEEVKGIPAPSPKSNLPRNAIHS